MNTIYKYQLETTDYQILRMPRYSEILTVQLQNNVPCLWAKVDTEEPEAQRDIYIFGTGNPIEVEAGVQLEYIGTYQLMDGGLVFHVFEGVV